MKYTRNSKQTTAMFKAFSQIVCRINITDVTDVGKNPGNFSRLTPTFQGNNKKNLNEKGLKPLTFILFQVPKHALLATSNGRCARSSLQFRFGFQFKQQIRFTKPLNSQLRIMISLLRADAASPNDSSFQRKEVR